MSAVAEAAFACAARIDGYWASAISTASRKFCADAVVFANHIVMQNIDMIEIRDVTVILTLLRA